MRERGFGGLPDKDMSERKTEGGGCGDAECESLQLSHRSRKVWHRNIGKEERKNKGREEWRSDSTLVSAR